MNCTEIADQLEDVNSYIVKANFFGYLVNQMLLKPDNKETYIFNLPDSKILNINE